ncbi:MAG: hypothetical protein JNM09_17645 [Blastocatellia bacterium]|nr:hypothetical protein [Blastocatellia bacterium]
MTEDGLPQNSVLAIAQTRDGYLWIATYNGLARFDGVRFTIFDKNNTPAFKTSRFHEIFTDASGALWLGVEDGGVLQYQNGSYTAFTTAQGLPSNTVLNVRSGRDGAILISTDKGAVWWRNGRVVPYTESESGEDLRVYLGPSGTHWIIDKKGLRQPRTADGTYSYYPLPIELPILINTKFHEDRHGALWIAPPRYGIFKIQNGVLTNYTQKFDLAATTTIHKILEDADGSLWFATINSGLLHFSNDSEEKLTSYTTANGLSSNGTRGLFRDREGTLWIGTDGGGLNRLTPQHLSGYSEAQGLAGNIAHAVLADRAGNVWVATHNGLSKISNGTITNYPHGETAGSLPLRGLQALHEDRKGRLWIGGYDGLCSLQNGVFSPAVREINGVGVNVWAIHEDQQGTMWAGTHFGLMKFKDGVHLKTYTTKDGLPKNTIRAIHEDRNGVFWLGTEGGLVKFQGDRFTVFTTKEGLVNDRVWSIYEDAADVLWLGTFDGGLSRFKDGRFTNYTTAQGLYNNGVFQILEDGRGHLWMSCYRGLYRVSKQHLNDFADGKISAITSTAFGKADGMLSSDCNGGRQPSGVKTSDGKLWFTTLKGVAVVAPNEITSNPAPPPVLIEGATLDRVAADISNGLRITPGHPNLEIHYTALSFIKAEQLRFKYKLIGQDSDWIEAGTRRTATYAHLPPGQYIFVVAAANSDGVWSESTAQLQVVMLPAFYQTWWFRLLVLLMLGGGIGLVFKWRLRYVHSARQAQIAFSRRLIESQEAERKRLANELHDSLGQDLLVIKNWIAYGQTTFDKNDPARETLEEISAATARAIESCREITYDLRPHQMDYIGLTEALRAMVNKVAQASSLQIEMQLDDLTEALPKEAEINLFRIVQEGLTNIVKHAHATKATVLVQRELVSSKGQPPRLVIEIRDNGCGFDPLVLRQTPHGMGLSGIVERAQMLGGVATIQSAPGRGTTISLTLPIVTAAGSFAPEHFAEEL